MGIDVYWLGMCGVDSDIITCSMGNRTLKRMQFDMFGQASTYV